MVSSSQYKYTSIPDVEQNLKTTPDSTKKAPTERSTYELSLPFQLLSGTVWLSMFLWGLWIATFYSTAVHTYDNLNLIFPDMYTPDYPVASMAIATHLIGAAFMSLAGAFQLVKYIRKQHPVFHRWVGRGYIVASLVASVGGLVFIFNKGDYGGRPADYAFATYGIIFFTSGVLAFYHAAITKDFKTHKLWAWRLYSLSLAAWLYRFDYYLWMGMFGHYTTWLHLENYQGAFDMFLNWAFYVPNLIIVEIVFRWGENAKIPSTWKRMLDTIYCVLFVVAAIFTIHAFSQLWLPSILGTYEKGWII